MGCPDILIKKPPSLKLWHKLKFFDLKKTAVAKAMAVKAETKGFEPLIQFPVYTLSRRAPSTTRTRLRHY